MTHGYQPRADIPPGAKIVPPPSEGGGRPVCPTGTVPSRLTSDQPTLLQPWTAREEEELQTARLKLQALEIRRSVAEQTARDKLNTLLTDVMDPRAIPGRLIEHADAVRDALAPFDSVVRRAAGGA